MSIVGFAPGAQAGTSPAPDGSQPVLAAAGGFTCAVLEDRTAMCWGDGSYGKLGTGSSSGAQAPSAVSGLTNIATMGLSPYATCAVRQDGSHACAIKVDKTVWCWGMNSSSQLGDGGVGTSLTPKKVAGISDAVGITATNYTTCVVRATGGALCWGATSMDSRAPARSAAW